MIRRRPERLCPGRRRAYRTQARLKDIGAVAGDHHRLVIRAPAAGSVTALTARGAMSNDPVSR